MYRKIANKKHLFLIIFVVVEKLSRHVDKRNLYVISHWPSLNKCFLYLKTCHLRIFYNQDVLLNMLLLTILYLIWYYRWKKLRSTNPETPKDRLFISNCFERPQIGSLSTLKYWINEHARLFNSNVLIYNWVYSKAKQLN